MFGNLEDKPIIERFIGSLDRECLDLTEPARTVADQQAIINQWLVKYHSYRPHEGLKLLTPDEFKAQYFGIKCLTSNKFQAKIETTKVSVAI